jgi:hypothetical protein
MDSSFGTYRDLLVYGLNFVKEEKMIWTSHLRHNKYYALHKLYTSWQIINDKFIPNGHLQDVLS